MAQKFWHLAQPLWNIDPALAPGICDTGCVTGMTAPDPAERVRLRIRHWMDTTGLTQREFAADLQRSQVWLQKILAGKIRVTLKDLDHVADAMRTTASELVRSEDERYQLELTPTEVRLLSALRRRPEAYESLSSLLHLPLPRDHGARPTALKVEQKKSK